MDEIGNNFLFLVVAHEHFVQIDIYGWLNQRLNLLVIMITSSNGKHFPRYLPFVRGIHRSPMNYTHKVQWRRALMFSLICAWTNGWLSCRDAGDLRRHCAHYDVTVMTSSCDIRWQRSNDNPWLRHQMETFSVVLAICAGNSPVPGEFPAQRPVTRSFDIFFDLRLNKRLSKQSWGWWFGTLSRPL